MFWPCETRTSTCRSFETISSGLYRFLAIAVLLDVKDIPQVGPLQWGWITGKLYSGRCCQGQCELVHTSPAQLRVTLMVGNELNSTGNEMKALVAAIALLWVSSTARAHDIYSALRDRDGHLCCGGQDCKPVEATVLPNGNYYLPGTDEVIPADMASPSPDDRFHHCTYYPMANEFDPWGGPVWEDKPKTRCFFAPMNST